MYTAKKRIEKLRYMHRNPVKRRLAEKPEDWAWSSFRHYLTGVEGVVEIPRLRLVGDAGRQVRLIGYE